MHFIFCLEFISSSRLIDLVKMKKRILREKNARRLDMSRPEQRRARPAHFEHLGTPGRPDRYLVVDLLFEGPEAATSPSCRRRPRPSVVSILAPWRCQRACRRWVQASPGCADSTRRISRQTPSQRSTPWMRELAGGRTWPNI
jgi:hypothetical protein